ncbi:unnamed protein product [Strongylus vulgaris]|uniref:Uncharacterized protein n=1 Tax=Strongylus vulgaris TaxID=40348 RepID=A0A3P7J0D4_STRVU|nr:unnamed protein product [Strongylus vulgaris]
MDDLLYRCFLAGLKFRLEKVPIDVGQFYAQCLLACVPKTRRLDMRKTKYKKFTVFLEEVNKSEDGPIVQIKKVGKGADMIEEVNKSHPALRSFTVTDEIIKDEVEESVRCGPKIHEYYSVTDAVLPVLRSRGNFSKGQLLESTEVREIVTDYVKKEVSDFFTLFLSRVNFSNDLYLPHILVSIHDLFWLILGVFKNGSFL